MEISRLCIPYTPFEGELGVSRVCMVSSTGVHLDDQEPYDTEGDTSIRIIPGDADSSKLMITHTHYDHADGDRDVNVLFPIDRLRELTEERLIGGITDTHIAMGFTQSFRELRDNTLPLIAEEIKNNKADIVFMTAG